MRPRISVIIDTYNYAAFIDAAIRSVLSQTIDPELREIIVVDDGSTDDTALRMTAYGDSITYHRKENGGQASAFNAGISLARGDYICFLDADDYFYPTKLARVMELFESDKNIGIAFNKCDIINEKGEIVSKGVPRQLIPGNIRGRVLAGYPSGSPSSGISIRKELAASISVPEEPFRISADYFYLNIVPLVTRVGVIQTSEHAYRVHTANLYIRTNDAERSQMHAKQDCVIWDVAAKMGFSFFRGLRDLDVAPEARTVRGRIGILLRGIQWLLQAELDGRLKLRSFLKLNARFVLPGGLYRKIQQKSEAL